MANEELNVSASDEAGDTTNCLVLSVKINSELNEKISDACRNSGLGKSALVRLALDRGIDRVLEQLGVPLTSTDEPEGGAK